MSSDSIFEKNIMSIYEERGRDWLSALPKLLSIISKKYNLSQIIPFENLSYNYVAKAIYKQRNVVIKLSLDIESLKKEAIALKAFADIGAIKLLEEDDGMLILEQAIPGTSLKDYNSSNKLEIACHIMKAMHKRLIRIEYSFPNIKYWLLHLDKDWQMPEYYITKARILRNKLLNQSYTEYLLHGDLHHDNILLHNGAWVVIDPKGVIGPAIFETFSFITDLEKDTEFVAEFFGYNVQEIREWCFVRAIFSICWNLEDNLDPTKFIMIAEKLYPMI